MSGGGFRLLRLLAFAAIVIVAWLLYMRWNRAQLDAITGLIVGG